MSKRIRKAERAPGGYWLDVEVTEAYTDGSSRVDRIWIPRDELRGKTSFERRQAILDAVNDDPLEGIQDVLVDTPSQTKDVIEARMVAKYADWQRWKLTRDEAIARNEPNIQNALTNKMDAAWVKYVELIQLWRVAPN